MQLALGWSCPMPHTHHMQIWASWCWGYKKGRQV